MPARRRLCAALVVVLAAPLPGACGTVSGPGASAPGHVAGSSVEPSGRLTSTSLQPSTPARPPGPPTGRASPAPTGTPTRAASPRERDPDPRWRFFTSDHHWYASAWYDGVHQIMIGFGCNASPWYEPDSRCPGRDGFHHGIDVAMACGTTLRAGLAGVVLSPDAPGTPGAGYGVHPFRLRITGPGGPHDILIGHARTVFVHPGERVRAGQRIALASDSGAPDGCHLHFEVRPVGGDYTAAIDPRPWLMLRRWSSGATGRR